jgi:hypothetical protein
MLAKMLLNRAGWEQLPIRMKEAAMKLLLELDPSFPGIMAAFETEDDTISSICFYAEHQRSPRTNQILAICCKKY